MIKTTHFPRKHSKRLQHPPAAQHRYMLYEEAARLGRHEKRRLLLDDDFGFLEISSDDQIRFGQPFWTKKAS